MSRDEGLFVMNNSENTPQERFKIWLRMINVKFLYFISIIRICCQESAETWSKDFSDMA